MSKQQTDTDEIEAMSFSELEAADIPETEFLIDGIIPARDYGIISAPSKCLKTHFAVDMAISLATATPFLDRFEVPKAVNAGIISNESNASVIKGMVRRIAPLHGIKPSDIDLSFVSQTPISLPRDVAKVERFIDRKQLKFLAIDPTLKVFAECGEDNANAQKMYGHLKQVDQITARTGCTIALVNHNRKARNGRRAFAKPEKSEITGAGFIEWMRFWVLLHQRRDWNSTTGEHALWMISEGSSGHGSEWAVNVSEGSFDGKRRSHWRPEVLPAEQAAELKSPPKSGKPTTAEVRSSRVLTYLATVGSQGANNAAIQKATKLNGEITKAVVKALREAKKIEPHADDPGRFRLPIESSQPSQVNKAA